MYEQVFKLVKSLHNLYIKKSGITQEQIEEIIHQFDILILLSNAKVKHLIGSLFYLYDIPISTIPETIREIIQDVYKRRLYDLPESHPPNFMDDIFLNQMQVWYKPYFKEEFWDTDIITFMTEFEVFIQTKQSYLLYWSSLVNMTLLFARINKCRYYVMTTQNKPFYVTPKTKDMVTFNNNRKRGDVGYRPNQNYPENVYGYFSSTAYPLYEIRFWDKIKDKLLQLLTNAFNCSYTNIYLLYKTFICFLQNNNNESSSASLTALPIHLLYICSQFGSEADTIFDDEYGYEEHLEAFLSNDFYGLQSEEHSTKDKIETLKRLMEEEFIYLSLLFPSQHKFARHEFTNVVPTTINPIYFVDTGRFDMVNIIGHDFNNHKIMKRKLHFTEKVNKDEINQFISTMVSSGLETEIMLYIHGLFHENGSDEPFTIANLKQRIKNVVDPEKNLPELTSEMIVKVNHFLKSTYSSIFLGKKKSSIFLSKRKTIKKLKKKSSSHKIRLIKK